MAKNELMMKMIIEMKDSIKNLEKAVKATKKFTKATEEEKQAAKKAKEEQKRLTEQKKKLAAAARKAALASKSQARSITRLGRATKFGQNQLRAFAAALTGIGALAGITFIVGKAIRSVVESVVKGVQASQKLDSVLRTTNHAIGLTRMELDKLSLAMTRTTTFSQTQIIEAQGIMATFTKLGKETFPRAIEAAADMSVMFGQTLQQSSIQLGTALNDPINGVGRLMRIGVSFSEQQKELIEQFMATNDLASAQGVILDELQTEFGEAAEAVSSSLIGKLQILSNALSLVFEQIGTIIAHFPSLNREIDIMIDYMFEFINLPMEQKIHNVTSNILAMIPSIALLNVGLKVAWTILLAIPAAFTAMASSLIKHQKLINKWNKLSLKAWTRFFDILGANFVILRTNISNIWSNLFTNLEINSLEGGKKVVEAINDMITNIWNLFSENNGIAEFFGIEIGAAPQIDTTAFDTKLTELNADLKPMVDLIDPFEDKELKNIDKRINKIKKDLSDTSVIKEFENVIETLGGSMNWNEEFDKWLDKIEQIDADSAAAIKDLLDDMIRDGNNKKSIEANTDAILELTGSWIDRSDKLLASMERFGVNVLQLGRDIGLAMAETRSMRQIVGGALSQAGAGWAEEEMGKIMKNIIGQDAAAEGLGGALTGLMTGIAGGLVGGLIGKLFSKKPKPVKKPIPVKVVNWGDMTQQLLKASARRAVGPMITTGSNSIMSSNFGREARI